MSDHYSDAKAGRYFERPIHVVVVSWLNGYDSLANTLESVFQSYEDFH